MKISIQISIGIVLVLGVAGGIYYFNSTLKSTRPHWELTTPEKARKANDRYKDEDPFEVIGEKLEKRTQQAQDEGLDLTQPQTKQNAIPPEKPSETQLKSPMP